MFEKCSKPPNVVEERYRLRFRQYSQGPSKTLPLIMITHQMAIVPIFLSSRIWSFAIRNGNARHRLTKSDLGQVPSRLHESAQAWNVEVLTKILAYERKLVSS